MTCLVAIMLWNSLINVSKLISLQPIDRHIAGSTRKRQCCTASFHSLQWVFFYIFFIFPHQLHPHQLIASAQNPGFFSIEPGNWCAQNWRKSKLCVERKLGKMLLDFLLQYCRGRETVQNRQFMQVALFIFLTAFNPTFSVICTIKLRVSKMQ